MEDDHKVSNLNYGMSRNYHQQHHHHHFSAAASAYNNLHNSESASALGLDDTSSLCSSPSPPSSRQHFYHYQGSFYGHHQPLQPQSHHSSHPHFTRPADKAATLHVVVNSGSSNPTARQRFEEIWNATKWDKFWVFIFAAGDPWIQRPTMSIITMEEISSSCF